MPRWLSTTLVFFFAATTAFAAPRNEPVRRPLPEGFTTARSGACLVSAPGRGLGAIAHELEDVCADGLSEIREQLGTAGRGDREAVDVRVVSEPAELGLHAPASSPPPSWAEAVAYPELNLVILSTAGRGGQPVSDLGEVLAHELSHLELRRAVGGVRVPRWLSEGVAIIQSERSSLRRGGALRMLAVSGELMRLEEMEEYPVHHAAVSQAYAQAADFVLFLVKRKGWHGIRVMLVRLRKGDSVERAAEVAYGESLAALEEEWAGNLDDGWAWFKTLTGTGALWGGATLLFVIAYVVAIRRRRRRLDQMEEDEEPLNRLIGTVEELRKTAPDPRKKDPYTVTHDGETHTLH